MVIESGKNFCHFTLVGAILIVGGQDADQRHLVDEAYIHHIAVFSNGINGVQWRFIDTGKYCGHLQGL